MVTYMKANLIFIGKNKTILFFENPNNQKPKKNHFPAPQILNIFLQKLQGYAKYREFSPNANFITAVF